MIFKKFNEEQILDTANYIKNWIHKNPEGKIAIGTDSIQVKRTTIYATAIAMFPNEIGQKKGTHIIYQKRKFKKRFDMWSRLWNEIDFSKEVGQYLTQNIPDLNPEIHIDINVKTDCGSNKLLSSARGYLESLGFTVHAKPDSIVASCVADMLVR